MTCSKLLNEPITCIGSEQLVPPALMFSVDARGREQTTFHSNNDDQSSFGRLYVDPTNVDKSGHTLGVCLAETVAKSRFGNKPLSDLLSPDVVSNDNITHRRSA